MQVDLAQLITAAAVTGAASAMATVLVLKVDVRWIKRALGKLEHRVERLEGEVFHSTGVKRNG